MKKTSIITICMSSLCLILLFLTPSTGTVRSASDSPAEVTATQPFTIIRLSTLGGDIYTYPAIAVDSQGAYRIVYQEENAGHFDIIYAYMYPDGSFSVDRLITSYDDSMPSIVVDPWDTPHIVYVRDDGAGNQHIMHAVSGLSGWDHTQVTDNTAAEYYPSVAADPFGAMHVVYMRQVGTDYEIYYATNYSGTWVNTRITDNAIDDYYPSIAVDADGKPHVVYMGDGDVYYATNVTGSWVNTKIASGDGNQSHPSIAVGAGGAIYVAYQQTQLDISGYVYEHYVYLVTNLPGYWYHEQVAGPWYMPDDLNPNPQIALDYGNNIHIAYLQHNTHEVHLAMRFGDQNWQDSIVADGVHDDALSKNDRGLLIDHQGYAVVTYSAWRNPDIYSLEKDVFVAKSRLPVGPRWIYQDVGESEYAGQDWTTSIVLDRIGLPHISFYNEITGTLQYNYQVKGSDHWFLTTFHSYNDIGRYNGIGVNWDLKHTIAYYVDFLGDLEFFDEDGVVPTNVDGTGDVGRYLSYARYDGTSQVSYYDDTHQNLKYAVAHQPDWTWQVETVDIVGDVGRFSSLALDTDQYPHIAYYDATNYTIKYARYDGNQWIFKTVDSEIYRFGFDWNISLELGPYDFPYIAYYDSLQSSLKCARWDGVKWVIYLVDNNGDVGQYNDLAVDPDGNIHIAYLDFYNSDLKYAYWDTWVWHLAWVDKPGRTGWFLSMDVDKLNKPHISYFDMTTNKVRYAHMDYYDIYTPMVRR